MNNNNTDWNEVPCAMLIHVLRDLCIKYRPDYRFENNSVSQETAEQVFWGYIRHIFILSNIIQATT